MGIPRTTPSVLRISRGNHLLSGQAPGHHLLSSDYPGKSPSVLGESPGHHLLQSECPRKPHSVSGDIRGHQILIRECPRKPVSGESRTLYSDHKTSQETPSVSGESSRHNLLPSVTLGNPVLSVGNPPYTTFSPQNIPGNPLLSVGNALDITFCPQ